MAEKTYRPAELSRLFEQAGGKPPPSKTGLPYRRIDIDTDDKTLRRKIVDRFQSIPDHRCDDEPLSEAQAVEYFESKILDDVWETGTATNDIMGEFGASIAKELGISLENALLWYERAWSNVEQFIRS